MIIRLLIFIVVLVGIAFVIPSNPYTDKFTAPTKKSIRKVYSYFDDKIDLPIDLPRETTTVHKWMDKNGNWQFSNTEPPIGVNSKSKTYKDDGNTMAMPTLENEK